MFKKFEENFKKSWLRMMKNKIGISKDDPSDEKLILELLSWMHKIKADYTNTFCHLMNRLKERKRFMIIMILEIGNKNGNKDVSLMISSQRLV